jgi:hypothetical protein
VYAKGKTSLESDRSDQEIGFVCVLSSEGSESVERGSEDTVCWGFEAGEEETRGCVQSGHDGLENKEMASTGAMFPPEIKDPNLLPIP